MKTILSLLTIALLLPATTALAEPTCVEPACVDVYDEGEDCETPQASGDRGQVVTVANGDLALVAYHRQFCFPTREGGVVVESVGVEAAAAGALVSVETVKAEDRYWGDLEYRYRGVHAFVVLPTGDVVHVGHAQGGFNEANWPDPPGCWTGAYVNDAGVDGDCFVAPLVLVP